MSGGAFLTAPGSVMLGLLLMFCRSSIICKVIGHDGAPNLARYEGHFPPFIPDLRLFVQEKRKEQALVSVRGSGKDRVTEHKQTDASLGKRKRSTSKSSDGLYVLDLLSHWDKQLKVRGSGVDEIDVVLRPGQAWTQELEQYKTPKALLVVSLEQSTKKRSIIIGMEPFGGFIHPRESERVIALLTQLPCRLFRLSKWVFDTELGALAMIYVQVARTDMNMLARLALFHAPKNILETVTPTRVSKRHFDLWIYENPIDSEPVPRDKVNIRKVLASLRSLAASNHDVSNGTFLHKVIPSNITRRDHSKSVSCDKYHNSCNHPCVERDDIKYEGPHSHCPKASELEVAMILTSLKEHH